MSARAKDARLDLPWDQVCGVDRSAARKVGVVVAHPHESLPMAGGAQASLRVVAVLSPQGQGSEHLGE